MKIIFHWLILALAVLAAAYFIPGIVVASFWPVAVIVAAILGFINTVIKPIVKILTLPINILTLGLFSLVINGLFFWFIGQGMVKGFVIHTFMAAFWGAILISVINWFGGRFLKED